MRLRRLLCQTNRLRDQIDHRGVNGDLHLTNGHLAMGDSVAVVVQRLDAKGVRFTVLLLRRQQAQDNEGLCHANEQFDRQFNECCGFVLFLDCLSDTLLFIRRLLVLFVDSGHLLKNQYFVDSLTRDYYARANVRQRTRRGAYGDGFFVIRDTLLLCVSHCRFCHA